jgi:hypothetical protein
MSFDTFKACINKLPSSVVLHFAGMSENWLNPDCTKMVLYAHSRAHDICVLTTLVGMSVADIEQLETVPFQQFLVHLPSNEGYEQIPIDEDYLQVLERVSKSNLKPSYMIIAGTVHDKVKQFLPDRDRKCLEEDIPFYRASTLAGNSRIPGRPRIRRLGIIRCRWNLALNSLLPNGDVVLCCMDFSMWHTLGNLLQSDYLSLFRSDEFMRVKKGLKEPSQLILCRYCELACDVSIFARLWNPIIYYLYSLKEIRNLQDVADMMRRVCARTPLKFLLKSIGHRPRGRKVNLARD